MAASNRTYRNRNSRRVNLWALMLSAFLPLFHLSDAYGVNVKVCEQEATTSLEKAYCSIVAKGEGASLPNFYSFKRNPAQTQYLLLLGPAKKAGVELQKPAQKPTRQASPSKTASAVTLKKNEQNSRHTSHQPTTDHQTTHTSIDAAAIDQCTLNESKIFCGATSYFLVINTPVKRVEKKALGATNQLRLRERLSNETSIQYVSNLYPLYIEKMLAIGLGDSTLSFTKFHAIYETSQSSGESFSKRFHEMYELLKRERQTMGIKQRYVNNFPEKISQCMQVTDKIITCDNVVQNWVYKKIRK